MANPIVYAGIKTLFITNHLKVERKIKMQSVTEAYDLK